MKNVKKRIIVVFYAIVKSEKSMTTSELAEICNVSARTIKKDMEELRHYAKSVGCTIHVKKGKGISVEINDVEKYEDTKQSLDIQFASVDYKQSLVKARLNQLARLLIIQNDYIKLDDLAEQLYLSRSSIKAELKELRSFFNSFHIELSSKPGSGVYPVGTELSKRLCMIELYEIHYPNAISNIDCDEFTKYFEDKNDDKAQIRKEFLTVLRNSENSLLDILGNRMVNYLLLVRNRIQLKHNIEIGSMYLNLLRNFREYKLASDILEALRKFEGFNITEEEIIGLELLLLNWGDIDYRVDIKSLYPTFYTDAKELTYSMFKLIEKKENINFYSVENSEEEMIAALIPIVSQIFFNCSHYSITGKHINDNGIRSSPLAIRLAQESAKMIEDRFSCKITDHDINTIAVRYYSFLDRIDYSYVKRRLIIFCRNGFEGARILRDKILRRYNPKWFEKLEIYEFYEVRKLNMEDYDYVIMDYDEYAYHYSLPFFQMSQIPTEKQMTEFYNRVILSGFDLEKLYIKSSLNKGKYYKDFFYETKKSFINFLSYKLCSEMEKIKRLETFIAKYTDIHIHNEVLTLFIPRDVLDDNLFEVYKLERKSIWEERLVEYIVVVAIDYQNSLELCRFVERATSILTINPKNIDSLIAEGNESNYFLELLIRNIKAG